tara:strand:- start:203 stop:376 length:174 start_codon:yes stop_codon:yes gene_type:complete
MPPKLNKKEIMKIIENEMKKNKIAKTLTMTPSGTYVLRSKKAKPSPPKKNNKKNNKK